MGGGAGMTSLWRKLFPKYDCRYCKDTGVEESGYTISVCRHLDMGAEMQQHYKNFMMFFKDEKTGLWMAGEIERLRHALKDIATTTHPDWAMRKMARKALDHDDEFSKNASAASDPSP